MKKIFIILCVMGFITSKAQQFDAVHVFNKQGVFIKSDPDANLVNRRGVKATGLVENESVDRWGNLYTVPGNIGYQNYWTTNHLVTWTAQNQSLALVASPADVNVVIGAKAGYRIIATGSANTGSANLIIAGTATSLGTFNGGGTVVFEASQNVGVNGFTGITVQSGATLQYGTDWTKTFTIGPGQLVVLSGATLEFRTKNTTQAEFMGPGMRISGTLNMIGNGTATGGIYKPYSATWVLNGGVMNLVNCSLELSNTFGLGASDPLAGYYSGTLNINKDSGLIISSNALTEGIAVNVAGNGSGISGTPQVAIYGKGTSSSGINGVVTLKDDTVIAFENTVANPVCANITGPYKLTYGCPTSGTNSLAWLAGNSTHTGVMEIAYGTAKVLASEGTSGSQYVNLKSGTTLWYNVLNASAKSWRAEANTSIILSNFEVTLNNQESIPLQAIFSSNGKLTLASGSDLELAASPHTCTGNLTVNSGAKTGAAIASVVWAGPLIMSGATSALNVNNVSNAASKLKCTTFTAASGFTVNVPNLTAGTYDILERTNTGTNTIPTVGTNASGLTASFSWVGNILKMTLS
ncbi:hypothetical protein [Flavobacterium branchiophilum]|nr:hypothetical protein [Flavobacterium branchiophilum]